MMKSLCELFRTIVRGGTASQPAGETTTPSSKPSSGAFREEKGADKNEDKGMNAAVASKLEPANWLNEAKTACAAVEALYNDSLASVRARVSRDGKIANDLFEADQHAAHGLAWFATYVQGLRELIAYAERLQAEGAYGETEQLLNQIGYAELLSQEIGRAHV